MAVEVLTTPSTWGGEFDDSGDAVSPYRRIVGVNLGEDITWCGDYPGSEHAQYNKDEVDRETLELGAPLEGAFVSFFNRFITKQHIPWEPTNEAVRLLGHRPGEYNCHMFAFWLKGMVGADEQIPAAPDSVLSEGTVVHRNLRLGEHGVVGSTAVSRGGKIVGPALHSVIGLGENTNECLQVLSTEGPLGIGTYGGVLDDYPKGYCHIFVDGLDT